jgi:hypothetical protein
MFRAVILVLVFQLSAVAAASECEKKIKVQFEQLKGDVLEKRDHQSAVHDTLLAKIFAKSKKSYPRINKDEYPLAAAMLQMEMIRNIVVGDGKTFYCQNEIANSKFVSQGTKENGVYVILHCQERTGSIDPLFLDFEFDSFQTYGKLTLSTHNASPEDYPEEGYLGDYKGLVVTVDTVVRYSASGASTEPQVKVHLDYALDKALTAWAMTGDPKFETALFKEFVKIRRGANDCKSLN